MKIKPTIACVLKLRPTCAQAATFNRWLWNLTGVYNWAVKSLEWADAEGRRLSRIDLQTMVNGHAKCRTVVTFTANHFAHGWFCSTVRCLCSFTHRGGESFMAGKREG